MQVELKLNKACIFIYASASVLHNTNDSFIAFPLEPLAFSSSRLLLVDSIENKKKKQH